MVPVIGMGTWETFDVTGAQVDACQKVTDAAFETGAAFVDSSPMYGEAERVLAQTLQGRRDRAIVATKVWTSGDPQAEEQIAAALRYFGGRVDVYQVHNLAAWPRRIAQLEQHQARGNVGGIGVTHYSPQAFAELRRTMDNRRIGAIQILYWTVRTDCVLVRTGLRARSVGRDNGAARKISKPINQKPP